MKIILLLLIRLYWLIVPVQKRKRCIFRYSCSKYVFEITKVMGFKKGINALFFRMNNCNHKFDLVKNNTTNKYEMILKDGTIINENRIAEYLI
ncbi:membrane protein insertion efficiency factor YidD [Pedobacter sp. SD-b]|uniref:Membrane protein insertion efficiency factor YidD n=1 Tax=Pedobacter segetis TaxID=2793069 RepID=A0ABS1BP14_9SPHI|nr:membrane protein insertion efficiency factor YidD [Pedobacter segetis]